jgi:hypothetical protein
MTLIHHQAGGRRGISLAELLIVLSLSTALIGLSAKLIQRVMQVHSKGVAFQRGEQSALRLASQLRRDIHAAAAVDLWQQAETEVVTLTNASDQRVEYRLQGKSLVRTVAQGAKNIARESFDFPSDLALHVEKLTEPERVVLVLESTSHSVPGPDQQALRAVERVPFAMRVEACLARTPRLAQLPAAKDGAP